MATENNVGPSEGDSSYDAERLDKDPPDRGIEKTLTNGDWDLTPAEVHTLLRALQKGTNN